MKRREERREFLLLSTAIGTGLIVGGSAACAGESHQDESKKGNSESEGEVTATEDLMREHGILRRAMIVYTQTASRLRANVPSIPPDALQKTAKLFRTFGEDYHERK